LFHIWPRVRKRLKATKHLALFLDFDGTLAPLQHRPEKVRLDRRTRQALRRLACRRRVTLWVVSGRRRTDVRRRVGEPRLHYAGLHGWEHDRKASLPRRVERLLLGAKEQITTQLTALPGTWIEDKGFSFAVHYRQATGEAVRRVRREVRRLSEDFGSDLRVIPGKKVWEVLPAEVEGKGSAVRALLAKLPSSTLAAYLGDDTSDESAFAALPDGLTVHVGPRRLTRARFRLRNPEEVREFLERVDAELP
jgi:trehalose 6-phosphate phosphatase